MKQHLTPKQVARAIGVSESSLKRWCDRGLIPVEKTAGGHRRLPIAGVLSFLREQGHTVVEPEVLGLPPAMGQTLWTLERARHRLVEALVSGDEGVCLQILMDLYVANHSLPAICDEVLAAAFHQIGDLWDCGSVAVYQERRACGMALRMMHHLRSLLAPAPSDAPAAIGCSLSGDQYLLALTMGELTLRDLGWNATNVGHSLPAETVVNAIREISPDLVWLSASFIEDEQRFCEAVNTIYAQSEQQGAVLAIGGRELTEDLRRRIQYTVHCDDMRSFANFSRSLLRKQQATATRAT